MSLAKSLPEIKGGPLGIVIVLSTAFLTFRLVLVFYRLWLHPLRNYPGPKLWAISDLPFTYVFNISGTSAKRIADFHRRYGPIIRIGPNRIAMDGSISWPQVYARRQGGQPEFEKTPGIFAPGVENAIIASPRDAHRRQRKQLAHAFSEASMREQETTINQYIKLLVKRVEEFAVVDQALNIVEWLNFTTFDIIGDLTFGESFGSLESSNYHPWVRNIFQGIKADAFTRACRNYPLFETLLISLVGGEQARQGDRNRALARSKAQARMELGMTPKGRRDFMTHMLQPTRDGKPGLSTTEIMANSPLLVVAGSETTASALDTFQEGTEIDMLSTSQLEYLHAALEETLRMYPPAVILPPRRSPGAEIEGRYVPPGVDCHVVPWATFRNPDHFLMPDSYYPERWLKPEHPLHETRFAKDNRSVFKPFSNGPRDCIGKNLAYSEMRLIVAELLYRFDVELLPGQEDWHAKQNAFLIWEKGPLFVKFTSRGVV
ncbi:unnamed protein product [Clonostachys rosea]|uniref:Uncharacterized protein n=1 Tax=Bionectria ochroleuca TaxID=29856 RepID=A0ABY6U676_BIOOC|nr:unnamed protein product [Clonostachys rosea]